MAAPRGESPSDRADASPQQDPDDAPESAAPGAPSADAVTREGFIAIADRRCTESFAELDAVEYAEENTLEAAAPSFAEVVRINRELIQDLRALQPPPGEEGRVAGFLDGASRAIDALDVAVASAAGGDAAQFDQDLARFEQLTRQTYEQATAYGFTVCFQPPV